MFLSYKVPDPSKDSLGRPKPEYPSKFDPPSKEYAVGRSTYGRNPSWQGECGELNPKPETGVEGNLYQTRPNYGAIANIFPSNFAWSLFCPRGVLRCADNWTVKNV